MKCIVSGYGMALDTSLASFGERSIPMWTDGIESPSFIAFGDNYLFAITENNYYASIYAYHRETVGIYRRTDQRGFSVVHALPLRLADGKEMLVALREFLRLRDLLRRFLRNVRVRPCQLLFQLFPGR